MNFSEVFTQPFLFSYDGRINRQRYWAYVLVYVAIAVIANAISEKLGGLFALLALYPSICVSIKRWHDRDKSGWWILIGLIPVIGAIWIFIEQGCLKGTDGPNRYGPDPLNPSVVSVVG